MKEITITSKEFDKLSRRYGNEMLLATHKEVELALNKKIKVSDA